MPASDDFPAGGIRVKTARQDVPADRQRGENPLRCHGRHRIDAAGCQGWHRKKGPRKRVSDTTQRKSQRSTRRRDFDHQAMSGGPFCRPEGPRGCGRRAARAKEAAAVELVVRSRWLSESRSICGSRLAALALAWSGGPALTLPPQARLTAIAGLP